MTAPAGSDGVPVLSVRDLAVEFHTRDGPLRVVEGVSFDVARGEVFGVVGESGSGKSVTMLAIMGLLPSGAARIAGGEVRLAGESLRGASPERLRAIRGRHLAMVFQDPMTSLNPVLRVGSQIAEAIRLHRPDLPRARVRERVVELLGMVGVPNPETRCRQYPHEFSGGMRQRAMIAMAIAHEPALLIADEPTTALDVTIQAQVMDVLAEVRRRTGASMVLITHNLGLVAEAADRVAVMYGGRIVESGPVDELFARPRHPYTVGLLASLPRLDTAYDTLYSIPGQPPEVRLRPPGCVFHPRCGMRAGRAACAELAPPARVVGEGHGSLCHFAEETPGWAAGLAQAAPPPPGPPAADPAPTDRASAGPPAAAAPAAAPAGPLLSVRDLGTQFRVRPHAGWRRATLKAVDGVSFDIGAGETLGLVGESGCGKSTLGRTVIGLIEASGGSVRLGGRALAALRGGALRRERRRQQMVFQDPFASLDPRMSVHEIVAEPLRINGAYDPARVRDMIARVGLGPEAEALRPAQFSGGQRQRIAIARALALGPELVILDEAVSALDVSIQAQVINLLRELQRDFGLTYLFISHDLSVVRHISHRAAVMYLGRIVEIGSREQVFDRPAHPYTQSLLSAVPVPDPRLRGARRRILLEGDLPDPLDPPSGCAFRTRCFKATELCTREVPALVHRPGAEQLTACHFAGPLEAGPAQAVGNGTATDGGTTPVSTRLGS